MPHSLGETNANTTRLASNAPASHTISPLPTTKDHQYTFGTNTTRPKTHTITSYRTLPSNAKRPISNNSRLESHTISSRPTSNPQSASHLRLESPAPTLNAPISSDIATHLNISASSAAQSPTCENPYHIRSIFSLDSITSNIAVDYVIFVDSDDYLELDAIEKCIDYIHGVDIVWFESEIFYDGMEARDIMPNPHIAIFDRILTSSQILHHCIRHNVPFITTAWSLFIDFRVIRDNYVRFIDGIVSEDAHFGVLLLVILETRIFKSSDVLYHYRMRPKSISNTMRTSKLEMTPSSHHHAIYRCFDTRDLGKAKQYYYYASLIITGIKIIEDSALSKESEAIIRHITPFYIYHFTLYLESKADPFDIKNSINAAKPYLRYYNLQTTLAISFPRIFRILLPFIKIAKISKARLKSLIAAFLALCR